MHCFLLGIFFPSLAANLPDGFAEINIATGLNPTAMTVAPDGRLFLAQKDGRILIVRDDSLLQDPFYQLVVDQTNERGLGGIALHPDFENNPYVYVYYTVASQGNNRISRLTANGDFAVLGSEEILLDLSPLQGSIHNGGAMGFGADGKLYVCSGDGNSSSQSQSMSSLLGKVLRLNPDGSIPDDNPYYQSLTGPYRAIYASGLRNPFSMSIQTGTGRIFVNDVGNGSYEEINEIFAGQNYGWDILEGPRDNEVLPPNYQDPLRAIRHTISCSIIGSAFYNPSDPIFPDRFHGKYFFGDYCKGYIKTLDPTTGQIEESFAEGIDRLVSILVSPQGDMYYLERSGIGDGSLADNTSTATGKLWKIFYTGDGAPFISLAPKDRLVSVGEGGQFSVRAFGKAPLQYQWLVDGVPRSGENSDTLLLTAITLDQNGQQIQCQVSNDEGQAISEAATLSVTQNQRPIPQIALPTAQTTYKAGDILQFSGSAQDQEEGNLAAQNLKWWINFHHDAHFHPAMIPLEGAGGTYEIPRIGEIDDNVWYRLYLQATDSGGLSQLTYRDIYPEKVKITVLSEPSGLWVNHDGKQKQTPFSFESVQGIWRTIQAPVVQELAGRYLIFDHWESEAENLRGFYAPSENDTLIVSYEDPGLTLGAGLLGLYYTEEAFALSEAPAVVRVDSTLDFVWGESSPDNNVLPADGFVVRWTGGLLPIVSDDYTFYLRSDDGARLWLDGINLIDEWKNHAPLEYRVTVPLEAGILYPIRVEYFEAAQHAELSLSWSSSSLPKAIIPARQLFPDPYFALEEAPFEMIISPNPVTDALQFRVYTEQVLWLEARILDSQGRELLKDNFGAAPYQTARTYDLSTLPSGVYMLVLRTGHLQKALRFVKL
ncbi:MAG: PQQ-dependent sugar dehydrogenase [Bacteroidota bacterium]